ncbi:MAG: hypothetical protein A3G43_07550 [Ignavibacteria bacterium RIFCSPLOWO2_12_FULL_56_21]|nr:MAG: hypothetical protein A3G43_07550 [Ignavibacteria bacterium RIFCSPLOWO2_12_FULL_56_21]
MNTREYHMQRLLVILFAVTLCAVSLPAQDTQTAAAMAGQQNGGSMPVGFGATFIDGKTYYLVNIAPEVAFGNLGVGLDLNLRVGTDGTIRKEDYDESYDYFRMVRYVRWAQKGDPFYIRLGQLDYSRLGHGSIVYNYRNSASVDLRKVGLELDVNFESFGAEMLYSDLARASVLGMRGYIKPLKFTSLAKVPVINNFEIGATYATDVDKNAHKLYNFTTGQVTDNSSISIVGIDLGLPVISYKIFKSSLYFDYVTIMDYGTGAVAGIDMHFSGLGLVTISGKYERRFLGDQFLPSYFDALYERERYVPDSVTFESKAMALRDAKSQEGYYGEVVMSVLGTFHLIGGYYQAPLGVKNRGTMHFQLLTGDIIPVIQFSAGYDKRNVGSVFKLDNNSILSAEVGYKPYPFMMVSTLYQWTFKEKKEEPSGRVIGYEQQRRIEPKVSFIFNF